MITITLRGIKESLDIALEEALQGTAKDTRFISVAELHAAAKWLRTRHGLHSMADTMEQYANSVDTAVGIGHVVEHFNATEGWAYLNRKIAEAGLV